MPMLKQEKIKIVNLSSMAIVLLLVLTLLYLPMWTRISQYNKEITGIRKVVKKLSQIEKDPAGFENKKNKIVKNLNAIKEKIPAQPMIPQVIEQITRPIKELGISLVSITPLEPVKIERNTGMSQEEAVAGAGGYIETPVELTLQADYRQFAAYLDRLRHLPRLIVVRGFGVRVNDEIIPKLEIKLKISVFNYGKD